MKKSYTYYVRDRDKRPIVTITLIPGMAGAYGKGIAFCAPMDNVCKKVGKAHSFGRAMKALSRMRDTEPIRRTLTDELAQTYVIFSRNLCKSQYLTETDLEPIERRILGLDREPVMQE